MDVSYTFPATKGEQAGKTFYSATVAIKYLVRLFRFDDPGVPPELRAQRKLNESRAQAIADYILENPESFVLPAITVSCDHSMRFESLHEDHGLGLLRIPIDACLLINDGQHRRKGLEIALRENPHLADQSITVTVFYDQGLKASQQMFSDINARATKPSGSLNALYDLRNPYSQWILEILGHLPAIKERIEMEAPSPPKTSSNLWGLTAFHKFVGLLTGVNAKNIASVPDLAAKTQEVVAFVKALDAIPRWEAMLEHVISAEDVREKYVIGHTVFLHALGILGAHTADLSQLEGLGRVEPIKASAMWQNRCVVNGKMYPKTDGVKSTAAVLMRLCGITLPEDLAELDERCGRQGELFEAI